MKNILCPVDFGTPSLEGMEYAARMAGALKGRLTLMHVVPSIWPEAVQMREEVVNADESISNKLEFLKGKLSDEFGITCDWHLSHTTETIEMAIGESASAYDLIVMGTNGGDDYYQYAFGTNTYHVISETKCPLLVVPEGCQYNTVSRIVYVYDPEMNPVYLADQLGEIADAFQSKVIVVHVVTNTRNEGMDRQMEVLQSTLKARDSSNLQWGFEQQFSEDIVSAVNDVMAGEEPVLLALSFHHRSAVERLFRKDIVKRISMAATQPVLVIHR